MLLMLTLSVSALAQQPVAEMPRSFIDTTYAQPAVWAAHTSAQFSSALTASAPGDTIVLDAGVTYIGNFTFPVKANPNNKWIYIVGSALSSLPAPGTRVVPATDAANMPKLVSTGTTSVITIRPGANYYRLVGLEITTASTQGGSTAQNPYTTVLVNAMSSAGNPLVDSITIDRCYIHASPTVDAREGFAMNASNVPIVDSYVSDSHQSSNDSQAVVAWDTPGPIKIVNNYLESTGENIMFGGAGGLNHPWVPSDIEIRGNYLFKPLSWVPATVGTSKRWAVKHSAFWLTAMSWRTTGLAAKMVSPLPSLFVPTPAESSPWWMTLPSRTIS